MIIAGYEISKEEYRALAYILVDPDAWLEHAAKQENGDQAIAHKIKKALLLVEGVSDEDYITRAEREALAKAEMWPTPEQAALSRELIRAQLEADLTAAKGKGLPLAEVELTKQIAELTDVAKLERL